jgi:hypothetical protein
VADDDVAAQEEAIPADESMEEDMDLGEAGMDEDELVEDALVVDDLKELEPEAPFQDDEEEVQEEAQEEVEQKLSLDDLFKNLTIPTVVPAEEDEEMGEPKKKRASGRARTRRRPRRAADDFERIGRVRSLRDLDLEDHEDEEPIN